MSGDVSESAVIAAIRSAVSGAGAPMQVGIGDDAAVLEHHGPLVACHDLLVEDVHFRRAWAGAADIGHKALAVNLSDLAAMGAVPTAALVGLSLPPAVGLDDVERMFGAMASLAVAHGVALAGGDTTTGPVLSLGVTALGRMEDGVPPLTRAGGRPGDLLCVTGPLGAAAAGLALLENPGLGEGLPRARADALRAAPLRPSPQVGPGRALAAAGAHAAIDISDGLLLDAGRLADASGCGLVLDLSCLPLAAGVPEMADAVARPADLLAATGGEDYELLVALPPEDLGRLRAAGGTLTPVGGLTAAPGRRIHRNGAEVAVDKAGWESP
ncbi:MAG: thiamine-phosphate kinase [Miltoncostaeaceae bacterium]